MVGILTPSGSEYDCIWLQIFKEIIQHDCCAYEKRLGHRYADRRLCKDTENHLQVTVNPTNMDLYSPKLRKTIVKGSIANQQKGFIWISSIILLEIFWASRIRFLNKRIALMEWEGNHMIGGARRLCRRLKKKGKIQTESKQRAQHYV